MSAIGEATSIRAGILLLAIGVASLSCRTPTQITIELRGRDFECLAGQPSPGKVYFQESGVLARHSLATASDFAAIGSTGNDCGGPDDSALLDLGSVVLVEGSEDGPVDVFAVAALRSTVTTDQRASVQGCLDRFAAFRASGEEELRCQGDDPCKLCVFAQRTLGFVDHSKLSLRIELDGDACAGVFCAAGLTCAGGECVSAATHCSDNDGVCALEGAGGGAGGEAGAGGAGGWVAYETIAGKGRVYEASIAHLLAELP